MSRRAGFTLYAAPLVAWLLVIGFFAANAWRPQAHLWLTGYAGLSLLSLAAFGWDKYRATRGGWRIRENWLLCLDLAGGWPGGLLARHSFHHKTQKLAFRLTFWLAASLHILWLLIQQHVLPPPSHWLGG